MRLVRPHVRRGPGWGERLLGAISLEARRAGIERDALA
jgi:hypothetical protein